MIKSNCFIIKPSELSYCEDINNFYIIDNDNNVIEHTDILHIDGKSLKMNMVLYQDKWCMRIFTNENHVPKGLVCYDKLTSTIY